MTLADLKNYIFRRTKTNATSFPAADMVIALNNANERVLSKIRGRTDNFSPTAWTTSDLTTGTATPVFDSMLHELVALWPCYQYAIENNLKSVSGFAAEIQVKEKELMLFYGTRTYKIFTVTIASPGVFTRKEHGLVAGDRVIFSTSGALPTGLSANTWYWVISAGLTEDEFEVSATKTGSAINTSGTQSGTHWFATDTQSRMAPKWESTR